MSNSIYEQNEFDEAKLIEEFEESAEQAGTEESSNADTAAKGPSGNSVLREILSWVWPIALAVVIASLIKSFVIINANVPTGSMLNTIQEGDDLFGFRLAYKFSEPKRGDIVIFKYPDNENEKYIKRVIGLPGETVEIRDAKIYIDGSEEPLDEPYLKEDWVIETGPYTFEIPEDCYLMLGDNRNNSKDARYWKNTYVTKDQLIGKAEFIYYPFDHMAFLN